MMFGLCIHKAPSGGLIYVATYGSDFLVDRQGRWVAEYR